MTITLTLWGEHQQVVTQVVILLIALTRLTIAPQETLHQLKETDDFEGNGNITWDSSTGVNDAGMGVNLHQAANPNASVLTPQLTLVSMKTPDLVQYAQ